jgi:hypothetical protein
MRWLSPVLDADMNRAAVVNPAVVPDPQTLPVAQPRNGRPPGSRSGSRSMLEKQVAQQLSAKAALLADPLLNLKECALAMGVSVTHARAMVRKGMLRATRTSQPHGHLRIRASECKRAVRSLEVNNA